jgi:subfamily B ATP-binding cassette protein MsbA
MLSHIRGRLGAKERLDARMQELAHTQWSLLKAWKEPGGRLLRDYLRPRLPAIAAMGVMSTVATALEALRLVFLLVTLQLIVAGTTEEGSSTALLGFAIDLPLLSELEGTSGLAVALLGLVALTALREIDEFWLNFVSYRVQAHFMFEVRRDLLDKLLSLEPAYFTDAKAGDLAYLQNTIVNRFAVLVPVMRTALQALLDLAVALVVLALISPELTLVLLALSGAFYGLSGLLRHRTRRLSFEAENVSREAATHYLEMVQGIRLVKLLGNRSAIVRKRYLGVAWDAIDALRRQGVFQGVTGGFGRVASAVTLMLLAIGLAVIGDFGPGAEAAAALGFLAVSMRAVENVRLLTDARLRLSAMVPHYLMIAEFILDDRFVEPSAETTHPRLPGVRDHVSVQGLSFEYEPGRPVLEDISIDFRRGATTAIIGPSGSGKTTLMEIMAGYRPAPAGAVTVDGNPLAAYDVNSYREQVGYVTQDTVIFHDSIRQNVTFLRRDASENEIRRAIELAAADDFIHDEGRDLDTVLGERGLKVSGGQRQRIALARMFLQDPPILLLDEATSSLDLYTEARLFQNLMALRDRKIVVVVAHRLSAIRHFDRIVVLHHGRIAEQGTHDELLEAQGLYFHLYGLQQYAPEASLAALSTL